MNDLRATARFVEREPKSSLILATLRETARVRETVRTTYVSSVLRDTFSADDNADGAVRNDLRDAVLIDDAAHPRVRGRRDSRESFRASDRTTYSARMQADLREVATLGDRLAVPRLETDLSDTATLNDAAYPLARRFVAVREKARLSDRLAARATLDLRDTAVLDDNAFALHRHRPVTRESARLSDRVEVTAALRDVLRETFRADDGAQPIVLRRPVVRERAFISGDVEERGEGLAWTANTLTWGMSQYNSYPFESIAGGFAAGADGVFVPTEEQTLPWRITTGRTQLGSPTKKRLSQIYTVGTHEEPLTLTVRADVNGRWLEHDYTQMARLADEDRTVRCTVGKGFSSNLFQFSVAGEQRTTVHSAEALVHSGARRI